MNNINHLSQHVETMYGRLTELYQSAGASTSLPPDLLPVALKELGVASEELQVALEELTRQNEELVLAQARTEAERQRYRNLFEFASDAYLITDSAGIICEANRAVSDLLQRQQQFLIGKPLASLVAFEKRQGFRAKLSDVERHDRLEVRVRMQRCHVDEFDASLVVHKVHHPGEPPLLRWLLQDITEQKRAEASLGTATHNPCHDRATQFYNKGDVIPLDLHAIWLVAEGLVKLTSLSDCGKEILVGLASENMLFGSSLTSLQTYQAIALSDVRLASLSLEEIARSASLAQSLLPLINQRLRQSESFLAIYGQIHVQDRINRLLTLLKQEIGEPVPQGTRLKVRLTHEDLAGAACTTRVTVTRLLGKLQQQGKVLVDSRSHLILTD